MAKTVTLAGATYQNVPAILLSMPTGGSAKFIEESEAGGGGSLPSGISAFDAGKITVNADFTTTRQTFNHKLGVIPDLVMVFADGNVAQTYSMLFALRSTKMGYRSSAYNGYMGHHGNSTTTASLTNSNSTTYGVSNLTATSFQLASASSNYYWRKGTYKYFAIKWA